MSKINIPLFLALSSPFPYSFAFLLFFVIRTYSGNGKINKSYHLLFLPFVGTSIAFIFFSLYSGGDLKDLVEVFRWSIISLIFFAYDRKQCDVNLYTFLFFSLISFCYGLMQFFFPEISLIERINSFYVSEEIQEMLFIPGFVRASGLSAGPAAFGLQMLFMSACSLNLYKNGYLNKKACGFMLIISLSGLIFAAAKSAISLYLIFFPAIAISLFFIYLVSYIFIGGSLPFSDIFDDVYVLDRLFNSASLDERLLKWHEIASKVFDSPSGLFIGLDRGFSLSGHSVFDSDYVFIFSTKGFIGLSIFLLVIIHIHLRSKLDAISKLQLLFVFMVSGAFNPVFTDIKFGPIYLILFLSLFNVKPSEEIRG